MIVEQIDTMLMGVELRPETISLPGNIIVSIKYKDGEPECYIVSDEKGTQVYDALTLKEYGKLSD